jgi:threonine dehydratase
MCKQLVDEVVLVEEEQIADAMRWTVDVHHLVVEGSGALAIAATRARLGGLSKRRVAAVLTGRNVDGDTLRRVLATP